jgi:hypothetical protein
MYYFREDDIRRIAVVASLCKKVVETLSQKQQQQKGSAHLSSYLLGGWR